MDWRKAKTILILAFLVLDSFLAYQLWSSRSQQVEMDHPLTGASSSLQDILAARKIKLEGKVPEQMPEMHYLNIKYEDFPLGEINNLSNQIIRMDGHVLESRLERPLQLPRTVSKGEAVKLYSGHILHFSEYEPDPVMSGKDKLVYLQHWDSYPFFGAVLQLNVLDHQVIGYSQSYFQVVNKGSGKKVISSLAALQTLVENGMIEYGSTIHSIDLGYYGHTYDAEIQVIAPVWRVVHSGGKVHYVNGITGVVEKAPSLPKKE